MVKLGEQAGVSRAKEYREGKIEQQVGAKPTVAAVQRRKEAIRKAREEAERKQAELTASSEKLSGKSLADYSTAYSELPEWQQSYFKTPEKVKAEQQEKITATQERVRQEIEKAKQKLSEKQKYYSDKIDRYYDVLREYKKRGVTDSRIERQRELINRTKVREAEQLEYYEEYQRALAKGLSQLSLEKPYTYSSIRNYAKNYAEAESQGKGQRVSLRLEGYVPVGHTGKYVKPEELGLDPSKVGTRISTKELEAEGITMKDGKFYSVVKGGDDIGKTSNIMSLKELRKLSPEQIKEAATKYAEREFTSPQAEKYERIQTSIKEFKTTFKRGEPFLATAEFVGREASERLVGDYAQGYFTPAEMSMTGYINPITGKTTPPVSQEVIAGRKEFTKEIEKQAVSTGVTASIYSIPGYSIGSGAEAYLSKAGRERITERGIEWSDKGIPGGGIISTIIPAAEIGIGIWEIKGIASTMKWGTQEIKFTAKQSQFTDDILKTEVTFVTDKGSKIGKGITYSDISGGKITTSFGGGRVAKWGYNPITGKIDLTDFKTFGSKGVTYSTPLTFETRTGIKYGDNILYLTDDLDLGLNLGVSGTISTKGKNLFRTSTSFPSGKTIIKQTSYGDIYKVGELTKVSSASDDLFQVSATSVSVTSGEPTKLTGWVKRIGRSDEGFSVVTSGGGTKTVKSITNVQDKALQQTLATISAGTTPTKTFSTTTQTFMGSAPAITSITKQKFTSTGVTPQTQEFRTTTVPVIKTDTTQLIRSGVVSKAKLGITTKKVTKAKERGMLKPMQQISTRQKTIYKQTGALKTTQALKLLSLTPTIGGFPTPTPSGIRGVPPFIINRKPLIQRKSTRTIKKGNFFSISRKPSLVALGLNIRSPSIKSRRAESTGLVIRPIIEKKGKKKKKKGEWLV